MMYLQKERLRIAERQKRAGRSKKNYRLEPLEGAWGPYDTLISGF
jgi:hypothetical protein